MMSSRSEHTLTTMSGGHKQNTSLLPPTIDKVNCLSGFSEYSRFIARTIKTRTRSRSTSKSLSRSRLLGLNNAIFTSRYYRVAETKLTRRHLLLEINPEDIRHPIVVKSKIHDVILFQCLRITDRNILAGLANLKIFSVVPILQNIFPGLVIPTICGNNNEA